MGKETTVLWTLATLPAELRDVYLALFSLILTKQIGIDLLGCLSSLKKTTLLINMPNNSVKRDFQALGAFLFSKNVIRKR